MQIVKKIIEITKPYWPRIFAGILISLIVSGITGAIAWSVKPATDIVLVEKKYEYLKFLPAGIFLLFAIKGLLGFCQSYLMKSAGYMTISFISGWSISAKSHLGQSYRGLCTM
jgi:subfamily B ATP-binding cassette protein MsbA